MEIQFIRKIAEGSFGFIDLVEDKKGRQLARKTLHSQRRRDEIHRLLEKRFQDEIAFMQTFQHPLLTPIIDAKTEGKQPYFLMPLAEASLKQDLKSRPKDSEWITQALFDILEALAFLHSQGYYHRDLCCANILRFETEQGPRYRLTDFGCVTPVLSKGPFHRVDSGHKRYAPLEITRYPMLGSPRSDIYSFGAILHEIFGERPRTPKKCISEETGPLAEIMHKCTRVDPEDRYHDIASLYRDLAEVLHPPEEASLIL